MDKSTLCLSSAPTSATNSPTFIEASSNTELIIDVFKKFKEASNGEQDSQASNKFAKQLNFGMENILRAGGGDLKSTFNPSSRSAFDLPSARRSTSSSSSIALSSPSASSSSSSANHSPITAGSANYLNSNAINRHFQTSYDLQGTSESNSAASLPASGRSEMAAAALAAAAAASVGGHQPSLTSLYQYYASLGAGHIQQQNQSHQAPFNGGNHWTGSFDSFGSLHKALPASSNLPFFDGTAYQQQQQQQCLSNVAYLGHHYGGANPYNSNSFYPSYSTLMYMAGQANAAGSAAASQQLPANGIIKPVSNEKRVRFNIDESASNSKTSSNSISTTQSGTESKKSKRSWSRAVFSNTQRRGLEKRFLLQKYITKPNRRHLADSLGLTDAQVKVWFQNRRMKWRHSTEYQEELKRAAALQQQGLTHFMAPVTTIGSTTSSASSSPPLSSCHAVASSPPMSVISSASSVIVHSKVNNNNNKSSGVLDEETVSQILQQQSMESTWLPSSKRMAEIKKVQ